MTHLTLIHSTPAPVSTRQQWDFNSRDLIALTCWMQRADAHGYRRVLIEDGSAAAGGGQEGGSYVLIYTPESDWASWGLARSDEEIVIWHCGSGADLGRFPSMMLALDSLPPVFSMSARKGVAAGPVVPRLTVVRAV